MQNDAFKNCTGLTKASFPLITNMSRAVFTGCTNLAEVNFPSLAYINSSVFKDLISLKKADFSSITSINSSAFSGCTVLTDLVLRIENLVSISNVNAFDGTPFASGGTGGVVYCPQNLISEYQNATNWSSLTVTFLPIEGSEYE